MMSEHWPRGTLVTRLYERDSLALSLIRSSGETRAHRSPSARPAILTVRRLLYSNGFLPPFSSAEFCSAYLTLGVSNNLFYFSFLSLFTLFCTATVAGLPVNSKSCTIAIVAPSPLTPSQRAGERLPNDLNGGTSTRCCNCPFT